MSRTVRARSYAGPCPGCNRCDPNCTKGAERLRPADRRRVQDDPRGEWALMAPDELRDEVADWRAIVHGHETGCPCDNCDEASYERWLHVEPEFVLCKCGEEYCTGFKQASPRPLLATPPLTMPLAPLLRAA